VLKLPFLLRTDKRNAHAQALATGIGSGMLLDGEEGKMLNSVLENAHAPIQTVANDTDRICRLAFG